MEKQLMVILGSGESGVGSAILAQKQGFKVFVSDFGAIKPKYKAELEKYQIAYEELQHTESIILSAVEVIKSPGIPDKAPIVKALHEKGIPVISEIEFGGRYSRGKHICITGSNGKTTTTMLIHHILVKAGVSAGLCGNVGHSYARMVAEDPHDVYVLELSSFQLDGMFDFRADIAILMNITPDHLDRYEYSFQKYIDSKFRIVRNMTKDDAFIFCFDDPVLKQEIEKRDIAARLLPFSFLENVEKGACINEEKIVINTDNDLFDMNIDDLSLNGRHNVYNSMAAGIATKVSEIKNDVIRESLTDFKGVEHRLEYVAAVRNVEFVNDSKATNVNSTWYALECMRKPVIWIAGGVDKGNDYSELTDLVRQKVRGMVCLGTDNAKLVSAFSGVVGRVEEATSMDEAVKKAYEMAEKGNVVLLSPCCASFDLFKNYEDRGEQFKNFVRNL